MNLNSELIHNNLAVGLAAIERGLIDRQQLTKLLTLCSTGLGMSLLEVLKTHKVLDQLALAELLKQLENESVVHLQVSDEGVPLDETNALTAVAGQTEAFVSVEENEQTLSPTTNPVPSHKTDADFPTMISGADAGSDSMSFDLAAGSTAPKNQSSRSKPVDSDHFLSETNRFEKIESHAKGGLGVVFLGRDKQLDRHVAVKEIRTNLANIKEVRERFEFEARVTGSLEHPCVVPVYAFGEHKDGSPYYAMRFIRGQSLKQAIDRLYGRAKLDNRDVDSDVDGSKPISLTGAPFRNLLTRLVGTCNGIAFAHSRGILHRDIKPSNIMLGKYGETLVVDWGLAKYIGTPEDASLTSYLHAGISGSSPSATIAGTTIGTPLFMSPEQAAGKLDELTPASDIYSLGSTLFMIVTGTYPYLGDSPREVVEKVKTGHFTPPRQIRASIPRPLAAICEKAMAFKPSDRYLTALEMASDIEKYLAGDPVTAYPEPWHVRIWRWIRNHQTAATAAAVLLLTTTIGAFVGMGLIGAEQKKTNQTLLDLRVANAETEQAFVIAEKALADEKSAAAVTKNSLSLITDDLVGQMLARNSELEETDRKLLQNILGQFENFTQGNSESPTAVALRAEGFQRIADLQRRLGDRTQSQSSYQSARELIENVLIEDPQQADYLAIKSTIDANTGILFADQGNCRDSIEHFSNAIETLHQLGQLDKVSDAIDLKLAKVLGNRANNYARLGDTQLAKTDYVSAAKLLGQPEHQFQPQWMRESARNRVSLASLLSNKMRRHADAAKEYQSAIKTYELLTSKLGDDPEIQFEQTSARSNLGVVLAKLNKNVTAESILRAAFDEAKQLAETYPGFGKFQRLFAETSTQLAKQLAVSSPEQAEEMLRDAKRMLTELADRQPSELLFKKDLAHTIGVLASLRAAHDFPEATSLFEQQLSQWQQLTELDPDEPEWEFGRIGAENNYASFLRKTGRFEGAIEHFSEILEYLDSQSKPDAELLWKVTFGIADSYGKLNDYPSALTYWSRLTANRKHRNWSVFESQRIIALLRTGQLSEGLAAAKQRLADIPIPKPIDQYDLACCYAIALEITQSKTKHGLDGPTVKSLPDKAMEMLAQSAAGGFFKQERWRHHAATDSDLDALRGLTKFREFCQLHSIKKGDDF